MRQCLDEFENMVVSKEHHNTFTQNLSKTFGGVIIRSKIKNRRKVTNDETDDETDDFMLNTLFV